MAHQPHAYRRIYRFDLEGDRLLWQYSHGCIEVLGTTRLSGAVDILYRSFTECGTEGTADSWLGDGYAFALYWHYAGGQTDLYRLAPDRPGCPSGTAWIGA